jgi:uncharacterized damage-inducible protein DinB
MHTKTLAHQLELSSYVLERNLRELSQADSLIEPQKGGNCLNWVLGHLTRARNVALEILGQRPPYDMEDFKAYTGEEPFTREAALPFEELKRRFKALDEQLTRAVNRISPQEMAKPAPFAPTGDPDETIGSLLVAFVFHEVYHVGQTGLLRRVVGKEGVVKPPAVPVA